MQPEEMTSVHAEITFLNCDCEMNVIILKAFLLGDIILLVFPVPVLSNQILN